MIIDLGHFALLCATMLTLYTVVANLAGVLRNDLNLIRSAKYGMASVFILNLLAYGILTHAFISDDFSVKFVAMHSSKDLPLFYKVTAVWGGMEGSLLLWELILSFYAMLAVFQYEGEAKRFLPQAMIVLGAVSFFFLFLLVTWSAPFERVDLVQPDGQGLNPILQNIGMVFHPPALYLGFVGFSIPFAFAIGSLIARVTDNSWIALTRRWTLIAWLFLTFGMLLGGEWAYVELGWGGYWAWDPVENASLIPWLTATAFLHSVIGQEKRDTLKIWNILLITATFSLTLLGTFITRSGILNSVHAFAKSNIGPAFLVCIVVVVCFSLFWLLNRQNELNSREDRSDFFSKDTAFLLNNILFSGMAFTVLYGTLFPLVAEALFDRKVSIQAPFFNTIMTPLAVLVIFLLGVGQVLGWRKTTQRIFRKKILPVLTISLIVISISIMLQDSMRFSFLAGMVLFGGWLVLMELIRLFKRDKEGKEKRKPAIRDARRLGATIVHLGVLLFAIGICGNFFSAERSLTIRPGDKGTLEEYTFHFEKYQNIRKRNALNVAIKVNLFKENKALGTLFPAKSYYPTTPNPTTEVAIYRTLLEDIYISISSINRKEGTATISLYRNRMVNFIWVSGLFFLAGIILCLPHKIRREIVRR